MCGDGIWPVKESDGLARWAGSGASSSGATALANAASASSSGATACAQDSGASPRVPPANMQNAAARVVQALPDLIEAGVPVTVALRAMAAALEAIGRNGAQDSGASPRATAATLPADQVAFGFLAGALKVEWLNSRGAQGICNLEGSRAALADSFGLTREFQKGKALEFDFMFVDATYVDLPQEY